MTDVRSRAPRAPRREEEDRRPDALPRPVVQVAADILDERDIGLEDLLEPRFERFELTVNEGLYGRELLEIGSVISFFSTVLDGKMPSQRAFKVRARSPVKEYPSGEALSLTHRRRFPRLSIDESEAATLAKKSTQSGTAMKICETGSGGVKTAATMKMMRIAHRHCRGASRAETIPAHEVSRMTTSGSWNTSPKAKQSFATKLKYFSTESSGGRRSVPKVTKKLEHERHHHPVGEGEPHIEEDDRGER